MQKALSMGAVAALAGLAACSDPEEAATPPPASRPGSSGESASAAAPPPAVSAPSQEAGAPQTQAGRWGVVCGPTPSGVRRPEPRCAIAQIVAADPAGQKVVLGTTVDFFDSPEVPTIRFRFSADAERNAGLGIKIDNGLEFRLAISGCDAQKCEAFGRLSGPVLNALQKGRLAQVAFISRSSGEVNAPLSLAGFAEALEALRPGEPR